MLAGRGVLANFPMAALGALVVYAAFRLIDVAEFQRLARFRRSELILALVTTAAVLLFGVLYGVLVAVGLSILDLLRRVARPHDGVLGYVPGLAGMHDLDDYPRPARCRAWWCTATTRRCASPTPRTSANARWRPSRRPDPVKWFVLNAEANVEVDITALDALDQLRPDWRRGIVFAMAQGQAGPARRARCRRAGRKDR